MSMVLAADPLVVSPGQRERGTKPSVVTGELEAAIVNGTLHVCPDDGSTQWTTRTMAAR
jgi:hypothetical protein